MADPYVGWTCGKCGKPVAGRFAACECGFAPETHLVQPPAPKPAPPPSKRDRGLPYGGCYEMDYKHYPAQPRFSVKKFEEALAAARAEGRREAIEECARLIERLLRNSCLADPGAVVAEIRTLAGGDGD